MKNTLVIAAVISLVVGAGLYSLEYTRIVYPIHNGQMLIYPAAFFSLLGLALLFRAISKISRYQ